MSMQISWLEVLTQYFRPRFQDWRSAGKRNVNVEHQQRGTTDARIDN